MLVPFRYLGDEQHKICLIYSSPCYCLSPLLETHSGHSKKIYTYKSSLKGGRTIKIIAHLDCIQQLNLSLTNC